jgi:hypothetical protein
MRRKTIPLGRAQLAETYLVKVLLVGVGFCSGLHNTDAQAPAAAPGVEVISTTPDGMLRQDEPVGPYNQPEWTTHRTFSTTRVYVLPPGIVEFVQYWTPEFKDGHDEHAFREEVEIGLPYRFQLDLYQNWGIDEEHNSFSKVRVSNSVTLWRIGARFRLTQHYMESGRLTIMRRMCGS